MGGSLSYHRKRGGWVLKDKEILHDIAGVEKKEANQGEEMRIGPHGGWYVPRSR